MRSFAGNLGPDPEAFGGAVHPRSGLRGLRRAMCGVMREGAIVIAVVAFGAARAHVAAASAPTPAVDPALVAEGRDLFVHEFRPHDRLSPGGDGLGPMFNERSCAGCHNQHGVGGAGAAQSNVLILGVVPPRDGDAAHTKEQIAQVHPGLVDRPGGIVLHKFSVGKAYEPWRDQRIWLASVVGSPLAFSPSVFRPQDLDPTAMLGVERAASSRSFDGRSKTALPELQTAIETERRLAGDKSVQSTVKLTLTQRNPPALFGAGVIDLIPDAVLEAVAKAQDPLQAEIEALEEKMALAERAQSEAKAARREAASPAARDRLHRVEQEAKESRTEAQRQKYEAERKKRDAEQDEAEARRESEPGQRTELRVTGRVARLPDGRIGRFGWKAQNATLRDFALDACAVELGLQTPGRPHVVDPRYGRPAADPEQVDLDDHQALALVSYLHSLPQPSQAVAKSPDSPVNRGRDVFGRIGCAECHVEKLGNVDGIYSDLLLHDMGNSLQGPGYYGLESESSRTRGESASVTAPTEWRTPPLWGCGDSAPYMHDGRSETLAQAIVEHDGEGARSARQFESLSKADRGNLLAFLDSLEAPQGVEQLAGARSHKRARGP